DPRTFRLRRVEIARGRARHVHRARGDGRARNVHGRRRVHRARGDGRARDDVIRRGGGVRDRGRRARRPRAAREHEQKGDEDESLLQSRAETPLHRYFPELIAPLAAALPERCVVDGEIVIAGSAGLDFEALLLRIHPAASRVKLLAAESPASFVAWDLLALGDEDLREAPLAARRERLEQVLADTAPPVHLSPATRERTLAEDWFRRFAGAGLDGVMAKRLDAPYRAGERTMIKVKHARTADCVVAGFRWHKNGVGTMVGSLLLGLYDGAGTLHHVGVTAAFTNAVRKQLLADPAPPRRTAPDEHPSPDWP